MRQFIARLISRLNRDQIITDELARGKELENERTKAGELLKERMDVQLRESEPPAPPLVNNEPMSYQIITLKNGGHQVLFHSRKDGVKLFVGLGGMVTTSLAEVERYIDLYALKSGEDTLTRSFMHKYARQGQVMEGGL